MSLNFKISGLDPALPHFQNKPNEERLSKDDAKTVEVIHTNVGDCGMDESIGHLDFYPNGGSKQPGCWTNRCAHTRAVQLYAESINSKSGFYGRKCTDYESLKRGECYGSPTKMGGMKMQGARNYSSNLGGIFYLKTNSESPFAVNSEFYYYAAFDSLRNSTK